jgi:hypothetical protein
MNDTAEIFGVKPNGETVLLGTAPITPLMKARDLIEDCIGRDYSYEDTQESTALYICERLVKWMIDQGWTPPKVEITPVAKTPWPFPTSSRPELQECAASGQMSAAQIHAHQQAGELN